MAVGGQVGVQLVAPLVIACAGCGLLNYEPLGGTNADDAGPSIDGSVTPEGAAFESIDGFSHSTSSTEFVDVPGAVLTVPAGLTKVMLVSAELTSGSTDENTVEVRYLIDGAEAGIGGGQNSLIGGAMPWAHFAVLPPVGVDREVRFQIRSATGVQVGVSGLSAVVFEAPVDADLHYQSMDAIRSTVSSGTPEPVFVGSFIPTTPGVYLILLLANVNESPGVETQRFTIEDHLGGIWPDSQLTNNRGTWNSMLIARAVGFPDTTEARFTERTLANSGLGGQVAFTRFLAMRIDSFADYQSVNEPAEVAVATELQAAKLTVPASTADRDLIVLQTAAYNEGSALDFERTVEMQWDGAMVARFVRSCDANCPRPTYARVGGIRTSAGVSFNTIYRTADQPLTAFETQTHILELPTP